MIFYLDPGHGYKGKQYDPGAVHGNLTEALIVRGYSAELEKACRLNLIPTHTLGSGEYDYRHRVVKNIAGSKPGLYAQLHCNAGGGKYSLVMYDKRSSKGRLAAEAIAAELEKVTGDGRVQALTEGERGFSYIDGIWSIPAVCGVVIEPGFLDYAGHELMWRHYPTVATPILQGFLKWREHAA
jgi:N-acetylmuramoyl-L-alanine amidase